MLLWGLSFFAKNKQILNNKKYIIIYIFIIITFNFPIKVFIDNIISAYKIFTFEIDNKNKEFFLKNNISINKLYSKYNNFNIILIFAEGTSFDIISKDITPNTYEVMNKSLYFINYFNHTAATFRGIRGQLISG